LTNFLTNPANRQEADRRDL